MTASKRWKKNSKNYSKNYTKNYSMVILHDSESSKIKIDVRNTERQHQNWCLKAVKRTRFHCFVLRINTFLSITEEYAKKKKRKKNKTGILNRMVNNHKTPMGLLIDHSNTEMEYIENSSKFLAVHFP